MRYEIINPSDPYTIEGDFSAVAAAVLLLGEGAYGAEPIDPSPELWRKLPVLFVARKPLEVFKQIVGRDFEEIVEQDRDAVIAALRTVTLGRKERSSMNDIGGRAGRLADALEKKRAAKVPDPVPPPGPVVVMGAVTEAMEDFLGVAPPEPGDS